MPNAYEQGLQKIIPSVLIYAFFEDQVLMIHRNTKANDHHQNKWNGVGGKIELNETPEEAASREFLEEVGVSIPIHQWNHRGQIFFPNFKPTKHEDWWVNLFTTQLSRLQKDQIKSDAAFSEEGTLHFVSKSSVLNLNLWDGDRHFVPLLLDEKSITGTLFYENQKCIRYVIQPL